MAASDNPAPEGPDPDDEARFVEISHDLAAAVERVVPGWIERIIAERVRAGGVVASAEVDEMAAVAGAAAAADVAPRMWALVETDLDDQRTNPLSLLRDATRFAHDVLRDLDVTPAPRDQFSVRSFPDDEYGLVPASWDEVDPSLHELGIRWGAAKAFLFKARRRAEGRT